MAAGTWLGVVVSPTPFVAAVLIALALVVVQARWRWLLVAGLAIGFGSGVLVSEREAHLESGELALGRVVAVVEATSDLIDGRYGAVFVAVPVDVVSGALPRAPLLVSDAGQREVEVGDRFELAATFRPGVTRVRRFVVAGRLATTSARQISGASAPHLVVANALRDRVAAEIEPDRSPERALLAGFLIGDTSGLSATTTDVMRRAGLTHYVAVSGSNVALFLLLWWLLLGPLGLSGWLRTGAGLAGLLVFAAMTRWEPSVIRASTAAAVLLVARSIGIPLSTWGTLSLAVVAALAISGELAFDVGFQLSVLAAIGVIAGSRLWRFRPRVVATALSASIAAQAMVSPVLLTTFGSVPILSPIANVVAGPLVLIATSLAGVGVLTGAGPLVSLATWFSGGVLSVAEMAAPWPQVGAVGWLIAVAAVGLVAVMARPLVVPAVAISVALIVWPGTSRPDELPAVVFLDVGQGDATLLLDRGVSVLIDGGPDPVRLARKLDAYGVEALDAVIVSHVHADHIEGLEAVLGRLPVGMIVAEFDHHSTPASQWLTDEASELGIPMVDPVPGKLFGAGAFSFEVVGPVRRYASPNDESIVVVVETLGIRVLMSGDIETFAQADLEVAAVDVLKVPHQGAATSDLAWLTRHAGRVAVVSVGPNDFGHPSEAVLEALQVGGAAVHRTDVSGDLVLSADQVSSLR